MTEPTWSEAEESTVIALYKRLLAHDRRNMPYDLMQKIQSTKGIDKTPRAIKMRLQNVSAVLEEEGLQRLRGLSPLSHYAPQTRRLVLASLPW